MGESTFEPNLTVLPASQLTLWKELGSVPGTFVLYGGTAVALRLGHRASIDFDFFGPLEFDPDTLYEQIPFLNNSRVVQKSANTLTCIVDRDGPVQISFFGVPRLRPIRVPDIAVENGIKVASLLDLAGMKAAVVQKRAESKDYLDLDAIIGHGEIDLAKALSAAGLIYGSSFSPQNTLKALSYYEDGNLKRLPIDARDRLLQAVTSIDLNRLPSLERELKP